jgi:flavin reductase (DIM6/NTAB) family NADH-FMN oxidoreductase RutF
MGREAMQTTTIIPEEFRRVFGSLPTAVAVVTTLDTAGRPTGTTANTVTALSLEPPMLLVCLDMTSATLAAVRGHGFFAVNFLAETGTEISQALARKAPDKFAQVRHAWVEGIAGSPVFTDDVVAHAECRLHSEIVAGDHAIVVGLISGASVHERSPLMYHRGRYSPWLGEPSGGERP